ncbi:MAG: hybrid sensor histidine kinase/response regulator [Cyanobacteria bacterium J083]|nr:MAG: hybrid sensor histidine kinase/response regulator [Cyanobacteria bacterium J083]
MNNLNEENYSYFLTEAQDLLTSIEQELLTLKEEFSAAKVHEIMRSAHTLKGAAASIGLNTIKEIAHVLEDVFKGLHSPEIEIDDEVEALLFEGYECLRMPLMAHFNPEMAVDEDSMLNRAAEVIARLQVKLGDNFNTDAPLPDSSDLGFDLVASVFESGVKDKLDELEETINEHPSQLEDLLAQQLEVLLGIAQSCELTGFADIARVSLIALEIYPEEIEKIARLALADLRAGEKAVKNGDRNSGGSPSSELLTLAGETEERGLISDTEELINISSPQAALEINNSTNLAHNSQLASQVNQPTPTLSLDQLLAQTNLNNIPEPEMAITSSDLTASQANNLHDEQAESHVAGNQLTKNQPTAPINSSPTKSNKKSSSVSKHKKNLAATVRVQIEQLERLDHLAGELLINQNQQTSQDEQIRLLLQELSEYLQAHQHTISSLKDWSDRQWIQQGRKIEQNSLLEENFDPLEMDNYTELQLLCQKAGDQTFKLENLTDALAQFSKKSRLSRESQQRLLTHVRDDLTAARMQPLGDLFSRFPRLVQQLTKTYNKPAELIISGSDVLIDKAIVERLYDPLLHLVRNAFDHGIDFPATRQAQGKTEIGKIEIKAYHQGNRAVIEVKDDGNGIYPDKIASKAVNAGLYTQAEIDSLSETQLLDILFEPGFSTASTVTDLSGRGVGLDVVKSLVNNLKGLVNISSVPGKGTTFSLEIPLSLNITKLLVCRAQGMPYALPLNTVEQILIPQSNQLEILGRTVKESDKNINNNSGSLSHNQAGLSQQLVLRWQQAEKEELIPIYNLADLAIYSANSSRFLRISQSHQLTSEALLSEQSPIVLVRTSEGLVGLQIEQILGEKELVIRPLGNTVEPPGYVYGCCILSNSRLALVIDTEKLVSYQLPEIKLSKNYLPDTGSDFTLSLPPVHSKVLLVVDDSLTLRQTLTTTLQKFGYQVFQAEDGQKALEKLQQNPTIDLIICDIEMPRVNGFEFLNQLRISDNTAKKPVVMLTSRSGNKYRQIALELGASAYLTKPYAEQELLETLNNLLPV